MCRGANRLASNSLTEALVAGDRVGALLAQQLPTRQTVAADRTPGAAIQAAQRPALTAATTAFASVLREEAGLAQLINALAGFSRQDTPLTPADAEMTNLHTVATLVAHTARLRTESRGCHRRSDHPTPQPAWERHLTMIMTEAGRLELVEEEPQLAGETVTRSKEYAA